MEKTIFEQMGGTYSRVGDYMLPNLLPPKEKTKPIGIWGQRHLRYLKTHRKITYTESKSGRRPKTQQTDFSTKPCVNFFG